MAVGMVKGKRKHDQKQTTVYDIFEKQDETFTPEQNLCCAILARAVNDLLQLPTDSTLYLSAKAWVLDRSYEIFSFDYVLDYVCRTDDRRAWLEQSILKIASTKH